MVEKNCTTGEEIVREMTDAEFAAYEASVAQALELKAQEEAEALNRATLKESAKAKLVAGEPLTEEEAATIVL